MYEPQLSLENVSVPWRFSGGKRRNNNKEKP